MRAVPLAVGATSLLACASYSGAITTLGLFAYVLPCVLVAMAAGWRWRTNTLPGLMGLPLLALALAEIVNLVSGDGAGPAAKSTAFAATGAGVAMLLAGSQVPSAFLLPLAGLVGGALGLGAAEEVRVPVVVAGVAALATLAVIERDRRRPRQLPLGVLRIGVVIALVGVAGFAAVTYQLDQQTRTPYYLFPDSVRQEIKPPGAPSPSPTASPTPTVSPTPTATASPTPVATAPPQHHAGASVDASTVLWVLGFALLPFVLLGLLLLRSAVSWRRLRRQLLGSGAAGAWTWAAARRASVGRGFAVSQSPDVLLRLGALKDEPVWVELAESACAQAFAGSARDTDGWTLADTAWLEVRAASPRWRRALAAIRTAPGAK